jgi:hypothetical protein
MVEGSAELNGNERKKSQPLLRGLAFGALGSRLIELIPVVLDVGVFLNGLGQEVRGAGAVVLLQLVPVLRVVGNFGAGVRPVTSITSTPFSPAKGLERAPCLMPKMRPTAVGS